MFDPKSCGGVKQQAAESVLPRRPLMHILSLCKLVAAETVGRLLDFFAVKASLFLSSSNR
jgi:hypothetical protein